MEHIERPKEVSKSELSVQNREQIQKNMQSQFNNIYDYLDLIADNKDEYSTEEIRIGTWIDGSPIYRKVISCNFGTLSTNWQILTPVPDGFKQLINLRAVNNYSILGRNKIYPTYEDSNWFISFDVDSSNTNITVIGHGYNDFDIYLIIEYTKGG